MIDMKTQMGNIAPRVDCPWCGRSVAVVRSVEKLWPHRDAGMKWRCRGSGQPVDLYQLREVLP